MSGAELYQAAVRFAGVVGESLIYGSVLCAVTALIAATALRRARPALLAGIWTVVLLKFAVPVAPALPISFHGLIDRLFSLFRADEPIVRVVAPGPGASAPSPAAVAPLWASLLIAAALLWIGGVVWLVARRVCAHRAARQGLTTMAEAPAEVRAAVAFAAAHVGVRAPAVRISDVAAPYVVGVLQPVAVVPAWLGTRGGAELHAALLHEMAHLSRRDVAVRLVQAVVGTLLFFWPLVSWINRRIDRAREMACDQWAIARGPLAPTAYARMLLGVARRSHATVMPAGVAGMLGRKKALAHRVDALLAPGPGEPRLGKPGLAALAVWAVVSLAGAARASADVAAPDRCEFDPAVAEEFMASYPAADADRDGVLSRTEACAYQLRLRRLAADEGGSAGGWMSPETDDTVRDLASPVADGEVIDFSDEICCNCSVNDAPVAAAPALTDPAECTKD